MSEIKAFPTINVATAMTGIGLSSDISFSDVAEIMSHILGRPIWTHEMVHKPTLKEFRSVAYELFPNMPTREDAQADYQSAAASAIAAYGETVDVPKGNTERTESPIETLSGMISKQEPTQ